MGLPSQKAHEDGPFAQVAAGFSPTAITARSALRAAASGLPTPNPLSALMSAIDKDRQESLLSDFEALAIEYELTAWLDP